MAGSLFSRFGNSERGNVAILMGFALVPMMLAGGTAIDYMRAISVKASLQNAVDAAALAAASSKKMSSAARVKMGDKVFAENWLDESAAGLSATGKFKFEGGGIRGTAVVDVPTTLLHAVGLGDVRVTADSFVTIPMEKKAEIALVLDYSGSMTEIAGGKVKYVAMKDAAKNLVSDLAAAAKGRVKFGLVPFSHHVRATFSKAMIVGQSGPGTWTGCTQDRPFPANMSDAEPTNKDDTKWGQPQAPDHLADGCSGYAPRSLTIRPLTDRDDLVNAQLDAMRPYAYTHIALGVEFGWHLLSPGAPFAEGAPYSDKTTEKYMVVLTDGEQTEPGFGPGGARTKAQGEANLVTLCENAKAKGITMMTISFGIEDEPTRDRLRNCATDASKHYFEAESGGDITTAFALIKRQIAQQVFLSK